MGLFDQRQKKMSTNGYVINNGILLSVPEGQIVYNIPADVIKISEAAKTQIQRSAEQIIFEGKDNPLIINPTTFPFLRTLIIRGYVIDIKTGTLLQVPAGQRTYIIPKEVKRLNPALNLMSNKVLSSLSGASEIIFEDGSIDKIPEGYFTFGTSFSNLRKLTLPNGLKYLGNNSIDPTKTQYNLPATIEYLGTNMYPEVQKLVLGNNVKTLGNAFASHDTNLVYVEVSGSIKDLPSNFVNQCKNLKILILREGVEKAGNYAFRNLNSLEYVELPDSFKMPFQTSMENRFGSNKRGNSKYDGSNGVFEAQENSVLTIKKTHNGILYFFQVRRGDFAEISFQNNSAIIISNDRKKIIIELKELNPNAICMVNIQEAKIQQSIPSPVPTNQPPQENIPLQNDNSSSFIYTEDEIREDFQKVYKEWIIPTTLFQSIDDAKTKIAIKRILFEEINRRIQIGIKAGRRYAIDGNYLYDMFEKTLMEIKKNEETDLTPEEMKPRR